MPSTWKRNIPMQVPTLAQRRNLSAHYKRDHDDQIVINWRTGQRHAPDYGKRIRAGEAVMVTNRAMRRRAAALARRQTASAPVAAQPLQEAA